MSDTGKGKGRKGRGDAGKTREGKGIKSPVHNGESEIARQGEGKKGIGMMGEKGTKDTHTLTYSHSLSSEQEQN